MDRYCFTFQLKAGQEDEYKRRHDAVWPELLDAIREAGVRNYSLFRRGQQVVAYCECEPTAAAAFARLAANDVNRRWAEYFEDVIGSLTDEHGEQRALTEVWHLD